MSIIESFLVIGWLLARAKHSAPSGGNGRRVICADRQTRLTTAPSERSGCSPASLPPEGTSWPSSRCTDARTSPGSAAGALPRRAFAVDCTCSEGMFPGGVRAVVRQNGDLVQLKKAVKRHGCSSQADRSDGIETLYQHDSVDRETYLNSPHGCSSSVSISEKSDILAAWAMSKLLLSIAAFAISTPRGVLARKTSR